MFNLPSSFSLTVTLAAVAGAFALGATTGSAVTAKLAGDKYAKLERSITTGNEIVRSINASVQSRMERQSTTAAVAEASAQERIVYRTNETIKEVPRYVTVVQDRACIGYGLVRVLDAAAQGLSPESLQLPAGQSDDACSPVAPSALAMSVAGNYGIARQNAQQLDALSADIRAREAIAGVQP